MRLILKAFAVLASLLVVGSAFQMAVADAYDGNGDDRQASSRGPEEIPGPFRDLPALVSGLMNATSDTTDTDGDGLPDSVERVIGTDWNNSDSDFDTLSDHLEVFSGLDPNEPDSNGDHLPDAYEVRNVTWDLDGDGLPNAWDFDNDGDGVVDGHDLSPFGWTPMATNHKVSVRTTGGPTYLSFNVVTRDRDHLRLIGQQWDWPDDDQGSMKDLDGSRNDVFITPSLELEADVLPDQSDVEDYGITIQGGVASLPLMPVRDLGNVIAFKTKMFYPAGAPMDMSGSVQLVWRVNGKTDEVAKALRASSGKYVSVGSDGQVTATAGQVDINETLAWMELDDLRVAAKGANGKYLSVDSNGAVRAEADTVTGTEVFEKTVLTGGKVALKASNGKYLTEGSGGKIEASGTGVGQAQLFVLVDKGFVTMPISLATYTEAFSITGLSVTENHGTEAGVFYSTDREDTLAAGLLLSYRFLHNASNHLDDCPTMLADAGINCSSDIRSFDHLDRAQLAVANEMMETAATALPDDGALPVIVLMEDSSVDLDLTDMGSDQPLVMGKLTADLTGEPVVRTRMMRSAWFANGSVEPMDVDAVMGEIEGWGLSSEGLSTLGGLVLAWEAGMLAEVEVGGVAVEYYLPEVDVAVDTASDIITFSIDSVAVLYTSFLVLNSLYRYVRVDRFLEGFKGLSSFAGYSRTFRSVESCEMGKLGKANKCMRVLDVLGFIVAMGFTIYAFIAIGNELGWTPTATGIAVSYFLFEVAYAVGLLILGSLGPVGAAIAALVALSDLLSWAISGTSWFQEFVDWILGLFIDWFSDIWTETEVNIELVETSVEITDNGAIGLTAGDRITYAAIVDGIVTMTSDGELDDLQESYIRPRLTISVPSDTRSTTGNSSTADPPLTQVPKKTTRYRLEGWAEPGMGMVNYPLIVGLDGDYLVGYNDCWWFFGWICSDEVQTGSFSSELQTLYFDVLPGNIDGFARWSRLESSDRDGDGIANGDERDTSPWKWDSDGDGLGDDFEVRWGSRPDDPDTDDDGLDDRWEFTRDMDPTSTDTDGDGLSDRIEHLGWVVPFEFSGEDFFWHVRSSATLNDSDADGINDWLEYYCLLNPMSADTDGDGTPDRLRDYYLTKLEYASTCGRPPVGEWTAADTVLIASAVVNGSLFVLAHAQSTGNYGILSYGSDGMWDSTFVIPDGYEAYDLAAGGDGHLYVQRESTVGSAIYEYDRDLTYLGRLNGNIKGISFAFDWSGDRVWTCDLVSSPAEHELRLYQMSDGALLKRWTLPERGYPGGMAVDPDGRALVTIYKQYEGRDTHLLRFHPDEDSGTAIGSQGPGLGQWDGPSDVVVDGNGDIIISEKVNNRVQKFDEHGRYLAHIGTYGGAEGQFKTPVALCLDGDKVYVADRLYQRVQGILNNVTLVKVEEEQAFTDTDGDGLTDAEEALGWNVTSINSTGGSGLFTVGEVVTYHVTSDPKLADSDGDGVPDMDEYNISADPRSVDTDGDGLSDAEEVSLGTNATHCDTDSEGLEDGIELTFSSDPLRHDTDGDGLTDLDEFELGSCPTMVDSDLDGLDDLNETLFGSDVNEPDPDGDLMFDGAERALGTSPTTDDDDGDGVIDGYEVFYHTNATDGDSDHDGLSDGFELGSRMDPNSNDTDGDGLMDKDELDRGYNPRSGDSDGDGVPDAVDSDSDIALEGEVVVAYDPGDHVLDFVDDLARHADVEVVTVDQLLENHTAARYIVLVGTPGAGEGTVGELVGELVEGTGSLAEDMTTTNAGRLVVRYGVWADPQTVVMLASVGPTDHIRVVGVLKSTSMSVSDRAVTVEYHNPRSCFQLDQVDVLQATDAMVWAKLESMETFNVSVSLLDGGSVEPGLGRDTGLGPDEMPMDRFWEISVSENLQDPSGNLFEGVQLELYYREADLDMTGDGDADDDMDLDEASLALYVQGVGSWTRLDDGLEWVDEVGVNTTDVTLYGRTYAGRVWAVTTHLSLFGISGLPRRIVPTVAVAGDDVGILRGETVAFDGTASTGNGGIVEYSWSVSNGSEVFPLEGPTPGHTFDVAGTYEVNLTVRDLLGRTASDHLTVTVDHLSFTLVVGPVVKRGGGPIEGATVTITVGETRRTGVTDAGGNVSFPLLETALDRQVSVAIVVSGFEDAEYTTTITSTGSLETPPPALDPVRSGDEGLPLGIWVGVLIIVVLLGVLVMIATRRRRT